MFLEGILQETARTVRVVSYCDPKLATVSQNVYTSSPFFNVRGLSHTNGNLTRILIIYIINTF